MDNKFRILSIDDNKVFLHAIKRSLEKKSFQVEVAENSDQALEILVNESINLILMDIEMPGKSGLSLLKDVVGLYPDIPVLMLSGHGKVDYAVQAIKIGADDFLEKPFPTKQLFKRLEPYVALWRQKSGLKAAAKTIFQFEKMVGESPAIERLKSLIVRVAASDASVLLLGESGTGKELAAQAIHVHSLRQKGPFVAVDCGALNETILESELFGHIKGAFTGAENSSLGLIRAADGGTLFLDEIGELPLGMQVKLLRTLQEKLVRPVGEQKSHAVDIRVVAATNKDLEAEALEGNFRHDLYYRIAAIPLLLPPLRERGDDITLLANHFLKTENIKSIRSIAPEAMRLLTGYHWPGNIRELQNVLHRAVAFCETDTITADDLPATIALTSRKDSSAELPVDETLASYELLAFQNALKKCDGNRRCAATLLGISEATLYRKMKQFDLSN